MPHCPLCASSLVWKKAAGGSYLGCPNYPKCATPLFNPTRRKATTLTRAKSTLQNSEIASSPHLSQQEFDQAAW